MTVNTGQGKGDVRCVIYIKLCSRARQVTLVSMNITRLGKNPISVLPRPVGKCNEDTSEPTSPFSTPDIFHGDAEFSQYGENAFRKTNSHFTQSVALVVDKNKKNYTNGQAGLPYLGHVKRQINNKKIDFI